MTRYRKLAVRSYRGHVSPPAETFTSGYVRETSNGYQPVPDSAVIDAALTIIAKRIARGPLLGSPKAVKDFLALRLGDLQYEVFGMILLSKRHTLIDVVEVFRGSLDGCSVHIRELAKLALSRNCASVICFHCHPSGNPARSQADELITDRIKAAFDLLEINVIDHVIIGGRDSFSFAEAGLL
jgi:DNA repair protein RadC